jgi:integrase
MATLNFVLKKKSNKNENFIYLRICHANHSAKYLSLHIKTKQVDWDKRKQRFKRAKDNFEALNSRLNDIEIRSEKILYELIINDKFSFDAFKKAFFKKEKPEVYNVNDQFIEKLNQLKLAKRFGSYQTYSNCYSSLLKFTSLDIPFTAIDFKFLKDFELFHIKLGNKPNSYGGYFRILRALHYEFCKLNGTVEPSIYKRFNIARLRNDTIKKSLTKVQLKKLIDYNSISDAQNEAKMIFLFSFYARGINPMDMFQLTDNNLEEDVLVYRRQKTGKQMRVKLTDEALKILKFFKNDSQYLFPYLKDDEIPKFRIRDVNSNINRRLKLIGEAIGIKHITMYYARHTFAELQYKAGIRIEIISQMLGHSDLKTTQTYLRSFSDDEVDDAASKVFDSLK